MHSDDIINDEQLEKAKNTPLNVIPREEREDRFDSWFVERVINEACSDISKKYNISLSASELMLLGGGYKIYTTMNTKVQKILEDYFENENNFPECKESGLNYSMVVTDSESGALVGIVGQVGKKEANRLLNHALVPHVPGSILKPMALYAPLIDRGEINWATVFDDVPVSFIREGDEYREYPRNSPDIYDGLTTVSDGLRLSKNTIAVRLCNLLGVNNSFELLRNNFGFDTLIEREGSLTDIAIAPMALGQLSKGVSLLKLTESFGVFPRDGIFREAISYYKIFDHNDRCIIEKNPIEKQVFKESTARIMNQLMMRVTESGTAKSLTLKNKVDLAGKTGTSGGSKDKMFVGYTPYFVAGIWSGYNSGNKTVSGQNHLKIWDDIMLLVHDGLNTNSTKKFSTDGLYYLPYCKDSGKIYSENCIYDPRGNRMDYGYFTADNQPSGKCDRHVKILYDTEAKGIATLACPNENLTCVSLIYVPDRFFEKEIIVTDAEFVCRDIDGYIPRPIDDSLPYFYYTIPDEVFVGRSKSKKQFNSNCVNH